MRARGWGRLITVITAGVRAVAGPEHELDTLTGLGFLGLHKCVTGEEGLAGVTANAVLRAGDVPDDDVAAAVAFLASERAAYLSGITITVDGGVTPAIF
jgi:enoyl-[acyl-carrier-protein] reductase (NADH)